MTPNPNADLIKNNNLAGAADTGTQWTDVHKQLFVDTEAVPDPAPKTFAAITNVLERNSVRETLRQIDSGELELPGPLKALRGAIADARADLRQVGLDLSTAEAQQLIDVVASVASWSPELTASIKALGVHLVTKATLGGVEDATAAELQADWDRYRIEQRIENAATIAAELMTADVPSWQHAQKWADAWTKAAVAK